MHTGKWQTEEQLNLERQAGVVGLVCPVFRGAGEGRVVTDKEER